MRAEGHVGRLAAIDRHVAKINSGKPHLVKAGERGLKAMNLSWAEQHHVHQQRLLPKPIKVGGRAAGMQIQGVHIARNPHSELGNVAEALTGYKEIQHIRQHPISGTIALASILPIGRTARLAELGVDAARGVNTAEHAVKVAQAAEDAKGLSKIVLKRRAVRLARRTSSEDARNILEQQRVNAIAKATKAARKNPVFAEHLPGEIRPETGGAVGLKVREAMRGVKKTYKAQRELQAAERAKRTAMLAEAQKSAGGFHELAGAQKKLAGEMPRAPFTNFKALAPHLEDIYKHVGSLNMLPHDKNRLVNAIKAAVEGKVPAPAERKLIESVFGKEVKSYSPEALKENGIGNTITDVLNIPRALESSMDLSGSLRQNLGAMMYDPLTVLRGYHQTLHAAISQKEYERIMAEDVHGDPFYHMAKQDGVQITELNQRLNQKEEAFSSNLAEHLHEVPGIRSTPGLKQAAHGVSAVVKASDRNYVVLLNRTRMRLYQKMVDQAAANGYRMDGAAGEKLRREIADTVNTLTGRGSLGKTLSAHRATFNAVFFSPGLMKSRINLLNPVWYLHASPFARQERLKAGMRLYGTLSIILAAAKAAGAQVSSDPTNADFGKIRVGNTRIDVAGGLTQYMRLIGQLEQGKITSSVTGKVEPLSNGPFKTSRGNVMQQFLRNKFAPVPGFAYDAAFGPGIGQKMTPSSVAGSMFVPLMLQDMYAISLQGPPWNAHINHEPGAGPGMAAKTFLPDLFGVGVQNYGGRTPKSSGSSGSFGGGSGGSFGGSSGSSFP